MTGASMVEVVTLGLSTPEAVPLYHVTPGGLLGRVLLPAGRDLGLDCDWAEICTMDALVQANRSLPPERILAILGDAGVDSILLDGVETCRNPGYSTLVAAARGHGAPVGLRLHGSCRPSASVDFILVDYVERIGGRQTAPEVVDLIRWAGENGVMVEVNAYIDRAEPTLILPIAEAARDAGGALHIHMPHDMGARSLYEWLERHGPPYSYLHTPGYKVEDTRCPNCRTIVAVRERNTLARMTLHEGRCPRCGAEVRIVGRVYERTRREYYRVTRGATQWLHPAKLG